MTTIKPVGSNVTELHMNNGDIVLFSYQTPVAAQTDNGFVRTDVKYSVTTSKHNTRWLDGITAKTVPQTEIDALTN